RRADVADIVEQFFEEAALAAQDRRLLPGRLDVHHQFLAGALHGGDIALLVEADEQYRLLRDMGIAERELVHVARNIIPVVGRELASETWPAKRLFNRILIVHARLNAGG